MTKFELDLRNSSMYPYIKSKLNELTYTEIIMRQ
jgi:hypothetical protein